MSAKHPGRYVTEFEGRHSDRQPDTVDQMQHIVKGMGGSGGSIGTWWLRSGCSPVPYAQTYVLGIDR